MDKNIFVYMSGVFICMVLIFTWFFLRGILSLEDYLMSVVSLSCLFAGLSLGIKVSLLLSILTIVLYGGIRTSMVLMSNNSVNISSDQLLWIILIPVLAFLGGVLNERLMVIIERITFFDSEMDKLVTLDEVTGLENPHRYALRVEEEVARSRRYKTNFTIILLKIDFFPDLVDVHGLSVCRTILKTVAKSLEKTKRYEDYLGVLGDGEFAMLLPETDLKGASIFVKRIKDNTTHVDITPEGEEFRRIRLTTRIGVAGWPDDGEDYMTLLRRCRREYEFDRG